MSQAGDTKNLNFYDPPSVFYKRINLTTQELLEANSSPTKNIPEKSNYDQPVSQKSNRPNYKSDQYEIVNLVPKTTKTQKSIVDIDKPLFAVTPNKVVYQNYESFENVETSISFRNQDKVAHIIRVECLDSSHFSLVGGKSQEAKVAPGMTFSTKIKFSAEENTRDYSHKLVCTTDREKFLIDVTAKGARGALDFPDVIKFDKKIPVKYKESKTLLVRNIGSSFASFNLRTEDENFAGDSSQENSHFTVFPKNGYLKPNEATQVNIDFFSQEIGRHKSKLLIEYSTGEVCACELVATTADVNVRLEKNSLNFENTYNGLQTRRTFKIFNNSEVLVNFNWCQNSSNELDNLQNQKTLSNLEQKQQNQLHKLSHNLGDSAIESGSNCTSSPRGDHDSDAINDSFSNLDDIDEFEGLGLLKDKLATLDRNFQARKIIANNDNCSELLRHGF